MHVGVLALVALALIWLPVLLRLLLLTGGSVKAGSVEASATGMFSKEHLMELLTRAKIVTTAQGDDENRRIAVAELDEAVTRLAFDTFDSRQSLDEGLLRRMAVEYERLRREDAPGPRRTSAMTRIVNEVRVRASSSIELSRKLAGGLLRSASQGERMVGLALTQETAGAEHFEDVLRLVQRSATAFEMYHALLAIQEMEPFLTADQRERGLQVLGMEREDPRAVGINADPGLPTLLDRTLLQLQSHGRAG